MKESRVSMGVAMAKAPKAKVLYAYDLTGCTGQELRAAVALQGLVNRHSAELYVIHPGFYKMDQEWLEALEKYYDRVERIGDAQHPATFGELFNRYREYVDELILFDPDSDYQWNIAITMAGLRPALPVTPEIAEALQNAGWSGTLQDLRGRFESKTAAYTWAVEELLPQCATFGLLSQDPRGGHRFHDYAVCCGLFCFWLDLEDAVDLEIQRMIFKAGTFTETPTVFGYAPQGDDLLLEGSPAGFGFVVSDWFGNSSVHCSIPSVTMPLQRAGKAHPVEKGKLYVSLFFSDGDNIQFDQLGTRDTWDSMIQAERKFPMGTTIASVLVEIAPCILEWYYSHLTEQDELIAGPSGWQFIYVEKHNRKFMDRWLEKNDYFLRQAGIRVANPWRFYPVENPELVNRYMTQTTSIDGVLCEGIAAWSSNAYLRSGKPVLIAHGNLVVEHEKELDDFLYRSYEKMVKNDGAPQFVGINTLVCFMQGDFARMQKQVDDLRQELKDSVVFLTPSDLIATFRAYAEQSGITEYE